MNHEMISDNVYEIPQHDLPNINQYGYSFKSTFQIHIIPNWTELRVKLVNLKTDSGKDLNGSTER